MVEAKRQRKDVLHSPLQDFGRRIADFRGVLHEPLVQLSAELAVPGLLPGKASVAFHENFRRLAGQVEHGIRGHPEAIFVRGMMR